ncbi:ArsR family transcriptional regulator [Sandarakinorhabdus cyanobacteriorum]|uniref:HTH-type transcriptional regulator n=1 Tax=Sandarakinorhabdus cyanobacteriorum TaxID=1981098 RepID=A0A255YBB3_9SPHN|nr:MarR family transcriptional regulator [Sandarakinorhabdus cyanobacteriorum]OYQ25750.1 ArsR family transcriptional regulator [Sandarakinorhabdus cyanobacteriorum]
MTEITKSADADSTGLPPAVEAFVLRWGDLGGQWGVNRSVAQIQALLLLSDRPQTAEDIAETLGMARSNVSNSLKELLNWKLVMRVPVLGDRRDHFVAETDLWQMASKVAQGRKEREIDPMVAAIRAAMAGADDPAISPAVRQRLNAMHDFITTVDGWYQQMITVPPQQIMRLIRLGARVVGLLRYLPGGGNSKTGDKPADDG